MGNKDQIIKRLDLSEKGGSPQNRIRTARQKIRVLSGCKNLRKYFEQIKIALAFIEVNR